MNRQMKSTCLFLVSGLSILIVLFDSIHFRRLTTSPLEYTEDSNTGKMGLISDKSQAEDDGLIEVIKL